MTHFRINSAAGLTDSSTIKKASGETILGNMVITYYCTIVQSVLLPRQVHTSPVGILNNNI